MLAVAERDRSRSASAGPELPHKSPAGRSISPLQVKGENEQAWKNYFYRWTRAVGDQSGHPSKR